MGEKAERAVAELESALGSGAARAEDSADLPTVWIEGAAIRDAAQALYLLPEEPFSSLLDLTWLHDEDGTVLVYLLRSLERSSDLRLKVRARAELPSLRGLFSNAAWYEREVEEACGVTFEGLGEGDAPPSEAMGIDETARPLHGEHELAFVLALERLAGLEAPPRAQRIRVVRAELLRLASHFKWYGSFSRDVGAHSAAFYADDDAARAMALAEDVAGPEPDRFIVGGVKQDLPGSWRDQLAAFVEEFRARLYDYDERLLASGALQARTKGVCPLSAEDALAFGLTGPVLRASGVPWDLREQRPYAGYRGLTLRVPTGMRGDSYDRARVRLDEMHESIRLLERCAEQMPSGPVKSGEPLQMSSGEATALVESSRGEVICTVAQGPAGLRVHVRSPTSPHLHASTALVEGREELEAVAIHGSINPGVALH